MKKMIKKVIAPVLVITVLFAVLRPFCIQQLFLAVTPDGDTVWNRKNVCLDGSKRF